jgi:hypothetical protein
MYAYTRRRRCSMAAARHAAQEGLKWGAKYMTVPRTVSFTFKPFPKTAPAGPLISSFPPISRPAHDI